MARHHAPTVLYEETYQRPGLKLRSDRLPSLPHVESTGFVVVEAYIAKAGRIERDGETLEFQDLRVYLREHVSTQQPTKETAMAPAVEDEKKDETPEPAPPPPPEKQGDGDGGGTTDDTEG